MRCLVPFSLSLALPITAALAAPALAQETPAPDPAATTETVTDAEDADIVVVATRLRGQVDAPQAPILTLTEQDITSYGAASIPDLLASLAPQTGSGRGRGSGAPVVLINGQRVADFRALRNIPPEAIKQLEVLPEEVALRFGYPPNQRVINFILKDNFRSATVNAEYGMPTRGGYGTSEFEGTFLTINGPRRFNISVEAEDTSLLTEAERDVIQNPAAAATVSSDADPAQFRSLIADSRSLTLNTNWSTGLGESAAAGNLALNGSVSREDSRSLSGLDVVTLVDPLGAAATRYYGDGLQDTRKTMTYAAGASLNKPLGDWQLTATVSASHAQTDRTIDNRADSSALVAAALAGNLPITGALPAVMRPAQDLAVTKNDAVTSLLTFIGRPLMLPAGEVTATVKGGFAYNAITSDDTRSAAGTTRLRRGDLSAGVNLGIPLTSRRENVLAGIGDLSLNLGAGIDRLSDFGTLKDWNVGLIWAPTEKLNLQASYLVNEAAPSLGDLGNPLVTNFNVPVYDFARGTTSLVSVTSGGNPALQRERQRDLKLSANWELPFLENSRFIAEYFRNRSSDVTNGFPVLTPAIEAAFPGRVTRDAAGNLTAIDRRPVTFDSVSSSRIRYGVNVSGTVGQARPEARGGHNPLSGVGRGGRGAGGPRGAGRGAGAGGPRGGGGGMAGMMGGGNGQGRWNLSVYHTVRLQEQVIVAPGGPVLDLLSGDALSGGGVARHGVEVEGGAFYRGFGLRFNGNYTAPTTLRSTGAPGASDLRFGGLAKLNLRAFVDLGQQKALTELSPLFKGSRLSLRVDNVFDARQRVTDNNGTVPLSYQPDLIDPQGRFIGIDFRKSF